MDKIILNVLAGLTVGFADIYMWHRLYNKKINFKDYKLYISITLIAIISNLNYYLVNNYVKIFSITLFCMFVNAYLFNKRNNEILIAPIVSQFIILIVESVLIAPLYFLLDFINLKLSTISFNALYLNILISILSCLISRLKWPRKLFIKLVKITDKLSERFLFVFLGFMAIVSNFFIMLPYYELDSIYIVCINFIIIIFYVFIIFKMMEQKNSNIKINNKYNIVNNTLKEVEQNVTRLKITNHENKNQLLTIRNMLKKGEKSDKIMNHIDTIVKQKVEDDENLMFQTSTIMNSMISSIIYSKMLTMKENKIDSKLVVDRDIRKLDLGEMDEDLSAEVCKIIGVYLDNAIEEVIKLDKKIVSIELYCEDKCLCIDISNNFEGEIDTEKINIPGYTTKNDGHGYGLSLVKEIIDSNQNLSSNLEINNDIFKQKLKIKM
ncbi:MAG: GHKL domain-containing protein [Clostridium sp.]|nr:GHKL domain-containing protein [Clostridium sp.]MCM1443919.1 GHKL domain-containing protein [Candidatus Amulumruptor caecigallinarius]